MNPVGATDLAVAQEVTLKKKNLCFYSTQVTNGAIRQLKISFLPSLAN